MKPRHWAPLMLPPNWPERTERDREPRSDHGYRNRLPLLKPYVWRPGDAEREAWVQEQVAAGAGADTMSGADLGKVT